MQDTPDNALAERLLEVLRPFAVAQKEGAGGAAVRPHGAQLFSYCCFAAERLARVSNPMPVIGVVLSGSKEFWRGDAGQRFAAGDVFVFPAEVAFDAVNVPSEETGIYESLLLEVRSVPEAIRRLKVRRRMPGQGIDLRVPLTADLVEALGHAASELAASSHATALAEHRLAEVLLLLREVPAAACIYEGSLTDRVGWLVLEEPGRRWTADLLGRAIGVGASTLRRKLADEGTSLRQVLASARMRLAHDMLASGSGNVADAAGIAGYASRSHFDRRFRTVYGMAPSALRHEKA